MTITKRRGRPAGTSSNLEHDQRLLQQAARRIFFGLSESPTEAFRVLLDNDDPQFDGVLRRLQRHWQKNAQRYVEEARQYAFTGRWRLQARALTQASPELARTIEIFADSAVGKSVLMKYGKDGIPAEPMSLGIVKLWEEIVRHSAVGPLRAKTLFDQAYIGWSVTGLEPDEAFLREFAKLCMAQADRLKAHADTNAEDRDTTQGPIETANQPGEQDDER